MIKLMPIALTVAASIFATPAAACMADGPEGYISGLIWENRHVIVPHDAMVLKVEVTQQPDVASGIVVAVREGPPELVGYAVGLIPENGNSCVGLGRLRGYVVVRSKPVDGQSDGGMPLFRAVDYLPGARDRSRGMKRETNWFYPGELAEDHRIPE